MMNTLIIYDNTGFIIFQGKGSLREPIGIPYMWVDVEDGKYIEKVDVSQPIHVPVLVDLPKSETQLLKEENMEIKLALAELADIIAGGM